MLAAARASLPVTFEVDQTRNVDHSAWSVIVDGTIELIEPEDAASVPLRSWASNDTDHFVQITIDEIGGRRIGSVRR